MNIKRKQSRTDVKIVLSKREQFYYVSGILDVMVKTNGLKERTFLVELYELISREKGVSL